MKRNESLKNNKDTKFDKFLHNSITVAIFIFFAMAIGLIVYIIASITIYNLPSSLIFLIPIAGGIMLYVLNIKYKFKAAVVWVIDVSLALSAFTVSLVAITKAYSNTWFNSITLAESRFAAALLTYIAICSTAKALIILFSKNEYESKYPKPTQVQCKNPSSKN